MFTHRRMAITASDVTLQEIIPISYDFSVVEGKSEQCVKFKVASLKMDNENIILGLIVLQAKVQFGTSICLNSSTLLILSGRMYFHIHAASF